MDPTAMIFDSHAHYDDARFDQDREAVLSSLPANGVGRVVNISSSMETVKTTVALAKHVPFLYAAVGVHPDEVADLTEADMETLAGYVLADRAAADEGTPRKIVAIGEIGYEYSRGEDNVPKDLQRKWFERQLALSNELDLPVVIHSRDAAEDTYEMLKAMKTGEGSGVVHCYSYSKEMARRFLDLGYCIGLGGVVTFKNGRVAKEVAAYVPDDRLVIETDCPYLAPTPFRGERNDSAKLRYVVEAIAALRSTTVEAVKEMTWKNASRLYRLSE